MADLHKGTVNGMPSSTYTNGRPNGLGYTGPASTLATVDRRFPEVCYRLRRKVLAFLESDFHGDELLMAVQSQVRISVDVIERALRLYGLEQLSLSYNGGKDCLVLLVLLLACLPAYDSYDSYNSATVSAETTRPVRNAESTTNAAEKPALVPKVSSEYPPPAPLTTAPPLRAIYIVPPDPFPEVDAFVEASTDEYHLDLTRYQLPMCAAIEAYLGAEPAIQAIFMGTRRTDPHAESLEHFTPTDPSWPKVMRIHPVLDWRYVEIWGFIRHFEIPFCKLYDQGFTSLGGTTDTRPNPALARRNGGNTAFRPAYELQADDEERLGRRW